MSRFQLCGLQHLYCRLEVLTNTFCGLTVCLVEFKPFFRTFIRSEFFFVILLFSFQSEKLHLRSTSLFVHFVSVIHGFQVFPFPSAKVLKFFLTRNFIFHVIGQPYAPNLILCLLFLASLLHKFLVGRLRWFLCTQLG